MHIYCTGLNHTTAPLDLREKLVFSEDSARSALSCLSYGNQLQQIHELVIVSTCNRTELYFTGETSNFNEIELFLSDIHGVKISDFHHHLYQYKDEAVVDHLYRVSTGLDSLVLGEPQILGQVTRALELALECGACGAVLSHLFRSAIHTGKRARAETAISRNPASISSLAAALVAKEVKDLSIAQVVVIGAGEMAELAVEALRKRGVRIFIGRANQEGSLPRDPDVLVAIARKELHLTLGITADPLIARTFLWENSMPQYNLGHPEKLAKISKRLDKYPTLKLAGNGYHGIGIPDCIHSGEVAVETLVPQLISQNIEVH